MTLDQAITHATDVAYRNEKRAKEHFINQYTISYKTCMKCAEDHRQLAEWLTELKKRRKKDERDL